MIWVLWIGAWSEREFWMEFRYERLCSVEGVASTTHRETLTGIFLPIAATYWPVS
jgi:hypothetical protein